jgi:hypothetical protein
MRLKALIFGFCLLLASLRAMAAPTNNQQAIAGLLDEMETANKKLDNIEIHFVMEEEAPDAAAGWTKTGIGQAGVAWFNGKAATKGRISYESRTTRWGDGAAGMEEDKCAIGFDGTEGRNVRYAVKHNGEFYRLLEGTVSGVPDPSLFEEFNSKAATGQAFSIAFFGPAKQGGLVQELRDDLKDDVLTMANEQVNGVAATRISVGNPNRASETWCFDSARGVALLSYDEVVNNVLTEHIVVNELTQAAPGVWYPSKATYEMRWPPIVTARGRPPLARYVYTASSVVANRPGFDESIYSIPFPPNCAVNDVVRGIRYKTAPKAAELKTQLSAITEEAASKLSPQERLFMPPATAPATSPATAPAMALVPFSTPSLPEKASDNPPATDGHRALRTPLLVLSGCLVLLGALAYSFRKRLGWGTPIFVLILLAARGGSGVCAGQTTMPLATQETAASGLRSNP